MAISTYKSFLMIGTGNPISYEKLIDIKDYPDLGGAPEMLDATTQSNGSRVYVMGIQETGQLTFTCNYEWEDFKKIYDIAVTQEVQHFSMWFGGNVVGDIAIPTGDDGIFDFDGYITVTKSGGGVNEVSNMTITIAPTTGFVPRNESLPTITLSRNSLKLEVGEAYKLVAVTSPAGETVTWSTSTSSVATVSGGTVTAVAPGVAMISAEIEVDEVTFAAECTVIVPGDI